MDRSQKADAVAQLSEVFAQSGVVVVTRNLGLSVEQSTELRSKMREAGATYKVAKNRLAKLALKDTCLLYTSPSPRDRQKSRMPSSA